MVNLSYKQTTYAHMGVFECVCLPLSSYIWKPRANGAALLGKMHLFLFSLIMLKAASPWVLPEWEGTRALLLVPDKHCSRKSSEGNTSSHPYSFPLHTCSNSNTFPLIDQAMPVQVHICHKLCSSGNAFVRRLVILSVLLRALLLFFMFKSIPSVHRGQTSQTRQHRGSQSFSCGFTAKGHCKIPRCEPCGTPDYTLAHSICYPNNKTPVRNKVMCAFQSRFYVSQIITKSNMNLMNMQVHTGWWSPGLQSHMKALISPK